MLRVICFAVGVLASVAGTHAANTFPTTFPFENELVQPPVPHAATPSYEYTEDDPGGYGYTLAFRKVLSEENLPYSLWYAGVQSWHAKNKYQWPPMVSNANYFNCTASSYNKNAGKVLRFKADTWFGKYGNYKFCEQGECCKDFLGDKMVARRSNEPDHYIDAHNKKNAKLEAGLCSDVTMPEAAYCADMTDGFIPWCFEYMISETERAVTVPCYDVQLKYYLTECKLYKRAGSYTPGLYEPINYIDKGTVESNEAAQGMHGNFYDKICHPSSYYYPELSKGSGIGDGNSDTESSAAIFSSLILFTLYLF